ncbi:hypothetical protein Hanom_Chr08g00726441 [Helianthus anomalus]
MMVEIYLYANSNNWYVKNRRKICGANLILIEYGPNQTMNKIKHECNRLKIQSNQERII